MRISQHQPPPATVPLGYEIVLPGRRGCYHIRQIVYRSTLNVIYLATEVLSRREVIIKENRDRQSRSEEKDHGCTALKREAMMLHSLRAGGLLVPECLDIFIFHGHTYLVMARIPGRTLAELHETGQATQQIVIRSMRDVCAILARLHAYGYVHHDVKPANIMIQPDGSAILIDYGSAERIRPEGQRRFDGTGTPEFMSLEQISGEARPHNDVFALGKTLETLVADPDPRLAAIMRRATAANGQRYQTIDEVADDLNRLRRRAALMGQVLPILIRLLVFIMLVLVYLLGDSQVSQMVSDTPRPVAAHNNLPRWQPILGPTPTATPAEPRSGGPERSR